MSEVFNDPEFQKFYQENMSRYLSLDEKFVFADPDNGIWTGSIIPDKFKQYYEFIDDQKTFLNNLKREHLHDDGTRMVIYTTCTEQTIFKMMEAGYL